MATQIVYSVALQRTDEDERVELRHGIVETTNTAVCITSRQGHEVVVDFDALPALIKALETARDALVAAGAIKKTW